MTIEEKLMNIQQELKAPKGQTNKFGGYKYRSCEDILQAVKPLLKENKTILILSDVLENIGDRYYVKATAILKDIESTNSIENTAYAREEETKKGMDGSQITGASSSYARKYALNGLFGIDDVKDSDATNDGTTTQDIKLLSKFEQLIIRTGTEKEKLYEHYKVKNNTQMTNEQLEDAIKIMEAKINGQSIN